ncbi:transmembrane protein, partial [Cystoisospora suis]
MNSSTVLCFVDKDGILVDSCRTLQEVTLASSSTALHASTSSSSSSSSSLRNPHSASSSSSAPASSTTPPASPSPLPLTEDYKPEEEEEESHENDKYCSSSHLLLHPEDEVEQVVIGDPQQDERTEESMPYYGEEEEEEEGIDEGDHERDLDRLVDEEEEVEREDECVRKKRDSCVSCHSYLLHSREEESDTEAHPEEEEEEKDRTMNGRRFYQHSLLHESSSPLIYRSSHPALLSSLEKEEIRDLSEELKRARRVRQHDRFPVEEKEKEKHKEEEKGKTKKEEKEEDDNEAKETEKEQGEEKRRCVEESLVKKTKIAADEGRDRKATQELIFDDLYGETSPLSGNTCRRDRDVLPLSFLLRHSPREISFRQRHVFADVAVDHRSVMLDQKKEIYVDLSKCPSICIENLSSRQDNKYEEAPEEEEEDRKSRHLDRQSADLNSRVIAYEEAWPRSWTSSFEESFPSSIWGERRPFQETTPLFDSGVDTLEDLKGNDGFRQGGEEIRRDHPSDRRRRMIRSLFNTSMMVSSSPFYHEDHCKSSDEREMLHADMKDESDALSAIVIPEMSPRSTDLYREELTPPTATRESPRKRRSSTSTSEEEHERQQEEEEEERRSVCLPNENTRLSIAVKPSPLHSRREREQRDSSYLHYTRDLTPPDLESSSQEREGEEEGESLSILTLGLDHETLQKKKKRKKKKALYQHRLHPLPKKNHDEKARMEFKKVVLDLINDDECVTGLRFENDSWMEHATQLKALALAMALTQLPRSPRKSFADPSWLFTLYIQDVLWPRPNGEEGHEELLDCNCTLARIVGLSEASFQGFLPLR